MTDIIMLIVIYIVLTLMMYIATGGRDITIYGKRIRFVPGGFLLFIGGERTPAIHQPIGRGMSIVLMMTMVIGMALFYISFLPMLLNTISSFISYAFGRISAPPQPTVVPVPLLFMFKDVILYIIIAIGVGVVAHEFAHAFVALREGIRLRSWGMGVVALIPLAFVEPDEDQFARASMRTRLNIVSAGSFANAVVALSTLILLTLLAPFVGSPATVPMITSIDCSPCNTNNVCPANASGLKPLTILYSMNNTRLYSPLIRQILLSLLFNTYVYSSSQIGQILLYTKLNSTIPITICSIDGSCRNVSVVLNAYNIEIFNKTGAKVPCLGVQVRDVVVFERNGHICSNRALIELINYMLYIFIVNICLYAFNAIPLIISDGSLFISILSEKIDRLRAITRIKLVDIVNILVLAIAAGISTYLLLRP